MEKLCKTCNFKSNFQNGTPACALHKREINPNKDFCSWYAGASSICDKCGQPIIKGETSIVFGKEEIYTWCIDCYSQIGLCSTCSKAARCGFTEDRTTPDYIMKTVSKAGFQMQTQVKNPDKIQIHCIENNCPCWSKELNQCNKDAGTCYNWIGKGDF